MTITSIGAGIGASLQYVPETSYGVVVASPAWTALEPNSVAPKKTKAVKESSPLAGGRMVDMASRRVVASQAATLSAAFEVCTTGFNGLINLMSASYTPGAAGLQTAGSGIYSAGARVQPSGSIYAYTHSWRNSIAGRSAAFQCGIPTTDAVVRQYDLLGAKPTKMAFACKESDFLTLATDWDGRVLEDPLITSAYQGYPNGATQTPYTQAVPSYAARVPYHFALGQLGIGNSAAAASTASPIDGVSELDLSIEHKLDVARQYFGNAGLKDEQLQNDVYAITGTVKADYTNKTYWADAFYSDTAFSIVWTFATAALGGTVAAIQFVLNNVFLNGDSPQAANKAIVSGSFPFKAYYDGTNEPLMVIVQTTESTI